MSEGLNRVILLGNLTADPELRHTGSGVAVMNLRLATSERFKEKTGEWKDRTEYHSVTVWGARAEALARMLSKGDRVAIEGGLRTSSYEAKDGTKRYKTEINATSVLLNGRGSAQQSATIERANDDFAGPQPTDDDLPF